jgi:hypothetical protein
LKTSLISWEICYLLFVRKHNWSGDDVTRFTELYSRDHELEKLEITGRSSVAKAEKAVEEGQYRWMEAVRERYRAEQIWSDKIRSFSTAGTFGLMASFLLFFHYQKE